MIHKLVWENVRHRPVRTFLSALLIAIPVTLVLTLVGLSEGMLSEARRRANGVGADIVIRPKGSSFASSLSSAPIPAALVDFVRKQPHVRLATGTVIHSISAPLTSAAGIQLEEFSAMSGGFRFVAGGPFRNPREIVIDENYARERNATVGATLNLMNLDWRVAGIVEPGKLNRVFIDLEELQELTGNRGKVTQIYVKVDAPENVGAVIESLKSQLEDYPIYAMSDFISLFSVDSYPALKSFINVMIGIAVVIGFAVVCLSMYMAVLQRTREIGILKSLGASKGFILTLILREALLLSLVGAVIGVGLSFGTKWALETFVPASLSPAIVPGWWPRAALIAMTGATLGALYPGWRAASQDPIEALAYE